MRFFFLSTMLFMNRIPVDAEAAKFNDYAVPPDHNVTRRNLRNIALSITLIYGIVSLVTVVFYPPISLVALVFPAIAFILTICAMRSRRDDSFWPCIVMATLGLILKLVACIAFIALFGFTDESKRPTNPRTVMARKDAHPSTDMKAAYFAILTGAELFLLLVTCCVQWHLVAFRKCVDR